MQNLYIDVISPGAASWEDFPILDPKRLHLHLKCVCSIVGRIIQLFYLADVGLIVELSQFVGFWPECPWDLHDCQQYGPETERMSYFIAQSMLIGAILRGCIFVFQFTHNT